MSGILAICLPVASVVGTFLVQLFDQNQLTMLLVPCAVGGFLVLLFAARSTDRRLDPADKPPWSLRELASTFYVNPRRSPDFAWAFASRFLLVMAYAFLVTYQAYYLLEQIGTTEDEVPHQIFLGTLVQSAALVAAALSPASCRTAPAAARSSSSPPPSSTALAMFVIAGASGVNGYLIGMAIGGLGFGMYMAVDLALVVDVLPDTDHAAKDLGVLNIAGALPSRSPPPSPRHPGRGRRQLRGPVRRRRASARRRRRRHRAGQGRPLRTRSGTA